MKKIRIMAAVMAIAVLTAIMPAYAETITLPPAAGTGPTYLPAKPATDASPPGLGFGYTWKEIAQMIPEITAAGLSDRTVRPDSTFNVDFSFNSSIALDIKRIKNFSFDVDFPSEFELFEGAAISNAELGRTYRYRLNVPKDTKPGKYYIRYSVSYEYDYLSNFLANSIVNPENPVEVYANASYVYASRNFTMIITVSETGAVSTQALPARIENLKADNIAIGHAGIMTAEIVNPSGTDFTDAYAEISSGSTVLVKRYIGSLAAQSSHDLELTIPAYSTAGRKSLTLTIKYNNGTSREVKQNFTLTVATNVALTINNLTAPKTITANTPAAISLNLINKGEEDYKNAHVWLYNGNNVAYSLYVGAVSAQAQTLVEFEYTFTKAERASCRILVTYENSAGNSLRVERNFTITVNREDFNNDTGSLNLQSLKSPSEELLKASSSVDFWLTNPTAAVIKGAEAFLYDSAGTQLDSVYIPEITENSTAQFAMSYVIPPSVGVYSYTLKINYKDANNKAHTINRSFSVNAVAEKKEETEKEPPEKPANVRVQTINNPGAIYLGVSTPIPYALVNTSKGSAYNAEVYVVNAAGVEIAREFIGNIAPSSSHTGEIKIKFDEVADETLWLYAEYENADESKGLVSKSFEQQALEYRASITDVAGYEWMMQNEQANIEFSVLNNGSETLLNVNAVLQDANGTQYGELYIGTIDPGAKKERLRFRNIIFFEPGMVELIIKVTYENASMKQFNFTNSFTANIQEPWWMQQGGGDGGMVVMPGEGGEGGYYDENGMWIEGMPADAEGGAIAWWVWVLIGCGVGIPGITVLIIFLRKRARKHENAEMENFIKMMAGSGVAAIPESPINIEESSSQREEHS